MVAYKDGELVELSTIIEDVMKTIFKENGVDTTPCDGENLMIGGVDENS